MPAHVLRAIGEAERRKGAATFLEAKSIAQGRITAPRGMNRIEAD